MMIRRLVSAFKRRLQGRGLKGYPACPNAKQAYVLVTSDMVHFELLDGNEECGGVEMKGGVDGDKEKWAVHVYGLDLVFPSLSKVRRWLGKPEVRLESQ